MSSGKGKITTCVCTAPVSPDGVHRSLRGQESTAQKLPLGNTRAETGACEHFPGGILLCSRIPVTPRCSGSKWILQGGPETHKATSYLPVPSEPQDSNQPSWKAVLGAGCASVSNPDEFHNRLQSLYVKVQALVRF